MICVSSCKTLNQINQAKRYYCYPEPCWPLDWTALGTIEYFVILSLKSGANPHHDFPRRASVPWAGSNVMHPDSILKGYIDIQFSMKSLFEINYCSVGINGPMMPSAVVSQTCFANNL